MTENTPLVTVGIPTYNRAPMISRAVISALTQDYSNIEIVISDNGSTDGTSVLCRTLAEEHSRIRFLQQPRNLGPTANFRAVLEPARGKYFMWLGDDDYIDRHYIGTAVSQLERDANLELVSGVAHYYRDGAFVFAGRRFSVLSSSWRRRIASYFWHVTDNGVFYGVARTATIRNVELPNMLGGDWLLVAAIAAVGKIAMSGEIVVHRELGGASESHRTTVRTLGVSQLHTIFPKVSIAWNAWRNIAQKGYPSRQHESFLRTFAIFIFFLLLVKTLREKLTYIAMRGRNLLKRLNPSYHKRLRAE